MKYDYGIESCELLQVENERFVQQLSDIHEYTHKVQEYEKKKCHIRQKHIPLQWVLIIKTLLSTKIKIVL